MPKILPWRLEKYPCVDCGKRFLPPMFSKRYIVIRTKTILCDDCDHKREIAHAAEIIPCDHCGKRLPRSQMKYGKSYKESQMICEDCYDTQRDPFDDEDEDDEGYDGEWW